MNIKQYIPHLIICCISCWLLLPMTLYAQSCTTSNGHATLDINNVRAEINTIGYLFNRNGFEPGFEVPKDGNIHAIFSGGLWLSAIDENGQQRVSALMYKGQDDGDFIPGPLDENGEVVANYCQQFDRLWTVYGDEIEDFIDSFSDYESNGMLDIPVADIPESILNWPGRNNPHFTDFPLPQNKALAPFWDQDTDGIYDPTRGDYPVINDRTEAYADQMIWSIFNDKGGHETWGGTALNMEIGMMIYAFHDFAAPVNNTVFVDYQLTYLGQERLDNVYFGQFLDVDLGAYDDDFIGCIPEYDLGFAYNGTANDREYGSEAPIIGMRFLKGLGRYVGDDGRHAFVNNIGMSSFTYQNNNFSPIGVPENPNHISHYLEGKWRNGEAMVKNGTGYDPDNNGEQTTYAFAGNPSESLPTWSECTADNEPADRRFIAASGPSFFHPNNKQYVRLAFNATFDNSDDVCVDVNPLIQNMEVVRLYSEHHIGHFADNFALPLTATALEPVMTANANITQIAAYPNPAQTFVDFNCANLPIKEGVYWSLYDAQGNKITQRALNENHFRLNRETMSAGMYFYQLAKKDGTILGNGKLVFE